MLIFSLFIINIFNLKTKSKPLVTFTKNKRDLYHYSPISFKLPAMIRRNSNEWHTFINRLESIKLKSNREVLCIKCWQMLNCKQKNRHLKLHPSHKAFLATSTKYASEEKICELGVGYNKLVRKNDGEEYLISPFAPVDMQLMQ